MCRNHIRVCRSTVKADGYGIVRECAVAMCDRLASKSGLEWVQKRHCSGMNSIFSISSSSGESSAKSSSSSSSDASRGEVGFDFGFDEGLAGGGVTVVPGCATLHLSL